MKIRIIGTEPLDPRIRAVSTSVEMIPGDWPNGQLPGWVIDADPEKLRAMAPRHRAKFDLDWASYGSRDVKVTPVYGGVKIGENSVPLPPPEGWRHGPDTDFGYSAAHTELVAAVAAKIGWYYQRYDCDFCNEGAYSPEGEWFAGLDAVDAILTRAVGLGIPTARSNSTPPLACSTSIAEYKIRDACWPATKARRADQLRRAKMVAPLAAASAP